MVFDTAPYMDSYLASINCMHEINREYWRDRKTESPTNQTVDREAERVGEGRQTDSDTREVHPGRT